MKNKFDKFRENVYKSVDEMYNIEKSPKEDFEYIETNFNKLISKNKRNYGKIARVAKQLHLMQEAVKLHDNSK